MAHDEPVFEVKVLGPISVRGSDGALDPGSRMPRLVFALLLADAGTVVSFDRLIDGLWGDAPPATARKTLQVHVSNMRRALGPSFPLRTVQAGYVVDTERLTIDAIEFEREVDHASSLHAAAPSEAAVLLASALGRWTGQPYADVADADGLRAEVTRLNELRLLAVEQRIEADLQLGRHERVLGELETLATDHPYRERFRMLQMLALYRSGRQTDALRAYDRTRRTLGDELGLDPGPELRLLHQQILEHSAELDLDIAVAGAATIPRAHGGADPIEDVVGDAGAVRGYELRERLGGRGGSTVHRAFQPSVGREVALRVIGPDVANRTGFVKRFESECRLLAELEHPHIVTLLDYWRDPEGAYVAMPLLTGGTVAQSLERGPWRPPAALRMLEQIGSALSHAHRRGVVHGDLRPTNVLLDDDGNAYLSDFAVADGGVPGSDPAGAAHPTPASRPGGPLRPCDDIQGLGLLTYEVLTGCRPPPGQRPEPSVYMPFRLPSAFDDVIAQATDPKPSRRFEGVEAYLRALRQAFGADVVTSESTAVDAAIRNPYKGLRSFGETDADDFFGRDDLLDELFTRLRGTNLTVVVGPSGSGKSSLVRAGLIPLVRRDGIADGRDVVVAEMYPGSYPFEELASALMRVAVDRPTDLLAELVADDRGLMRVCKQILPDDDTDLVLVIDQLEELFALTPEESARADFLANLVTVATDERSRVRVVATLRADFLDRPLDSPAFGVLMRTSMMTVARMGDAGVADAIELPARRVGLEIEPGLVPTIQRDVAEEPGALPMLQYALTELAEAREGRMLTIRGYERTGGVIGALAARAEEIYGDLSPSGQGVAEEVFVRLVNVSDDADDTRRRVRRTELDALGLDARSLASVIDTYGSFRLLSFDRDPVTRGPTVEVAHEALIREWPRYRRWIDARRDDLRTQRRLQVAVAEWNQADRHQSFLIAGGRLERYEQWADTTRVRPTEDERSFLDESRRFEQERADATARRRRHVVLGLSLLTLAAVVLASIALVQRRRAVDEAAAANRLRSEAEGAAAADTAASLVSRARAISDPDLGLLLALEAHDLLREHGGEDELVSSAVLQSAYDHRIDRRFPSYAAGVGEYSAAAPSGDGTRFVQLILGPTQPGDFRWRDAVVVDIATGDVLFTIDLKGRGHHVVWDVDDDVILVGTREGLIEMRSPEGEQLDSVEVADGWAQPVALDDSHLFYRDQAPVQDDLPSTVTVLDLDADEVLFETPKAWETGVTEEHLWIVDVDLVIRAYRRGTWEEVDTVDRGWESPFDGSVASVEGSEEIWVLDGDRATLHDLATSEQLASFEIDARDADRLTPSPDGRLLVVSGPGSTAQLLDATTGDELTELIVPDDPPFRPVWVPSSRSLMTFSGRETIVWDLGPPDGPAAVWPGLGFVPTVTAELTNGDLFFGSSEGAGEIRDPTGTVRRRVFDARDGASAPPVVSRDGSTIVLPGPEGVEIYDVGTGAVRAHGPEGFTRPLAVSDDGSSLIVGTDRDPVDGRHLVGVVDGTTGALDRRLGSLHDGERAAYRSDGRLAVVPIDRWEAGEPIPTGSGLWVFDVTNGDVEATGPPQRCITSVAISDDGRTLASGGCDGRVSLFDWSTLTESDEPWTSEVARVAPDDRPVVGVAFGDDDRLIVTREDGQIEMYSTDIDSAVALGRVPDLDLMSRLDVGAEVGIPDVRGSMVWVGTRDRLTIASEGGGGAIGVPLDLDEVADFARTALARELTEDECLEYLASLGSGSCPGG